MSGATWLVLLVGWLCGRVLLWRIPTLSAVPPMRAAMPLADEQSRHISVIIPARNEAHNLPHLLGSLRTQDGADIDFAVIVADDGSTDETAEIARQWGAKVLAVPPLPEGWRGKPWACHNGASMADGSLLVFLDADTVAEPSFLRTIAAATGVLTIQPYHLVPTFAEQWSACFNLVVWMGTGAALPRFAQVGRATGGFGPCLVCPRTVYNAIGGHAHVAAATLDHFAFSQACARQGFPVAAVSGRGVLGFRMYPSGLRSLIEGWSKSFATGATSTPRGILVAVVVWVCGSWTAAVMLAQAFWTHAPVLTTVVSAVGYLAYVWWFYRVLREVGSFRRGVALLYPLYVGFFIALFGLSGWKTWIRKSATWKNRAIPLAGSGKVRR